MYNVSHAILNSTPVPVTASLPSGEDEPAEQACLHRQANYISISGPTAEDQFDQPSRLWHPLGNGVHSVVWRALKSTTPLAMSSDNSVKSEDSSLDRVDQLSQWVAVKVVYDNRTTPPHDIVREAAILQAVSHPNIISFVGFVQGGPNAPYALYMPLIPLPLTALLSSPFFTASPLTGPYSALVRPVFAAYNGPDGVNPFGVVVKSLVHQLILAIAYLHSMDPPIAHRDINPGNVLIDHDGTVKLIDFGIAWSTRHVKISSETTHVSKISPRHHFDGWTETEEKMCCEIATGPHRAPELLFSPQTYSAAATDLWSLGTTVAQFFTPLRLIPSYSPMSSPSSAASDEGDQMITGPFLISPRLQTKIDYNATWERLSLFDGSRGELGLAWSIFKLRGTPNEETWPTFSSLPDVKKIEFQVTGRRPLNTVLPHLSTPWIPNDAVEESPLSLIDSLLAYPPESRLSAAKALTHPWFSGDIILPLTHSGRSVEDISSSENKRWGGFTLGEWLEPAIRKEANQVTSNEASNQ